MPCLRRLPWANWISGEVARSGKFPAAQHLAELVKLVTAGSITRDQAREVLMESVETGRSPSQIVHEHGFAQVSDESALEAEVRDQVPELAVHRTSAELRTAYAGRGDFVLNVEAGVERVRRHTTAAEVRRVAEFFEA